MTAVRDARAVAVLVNVKQALDELCEATGRTSLDVIDLGGGSGVFAVPLAEAGHRVTVVDPSPDALATLSRRAAESEASVRVSGVQGDAAGLVNLVGAASVDVVLCHGLLEIVDDPTVALAAAAACLRSGGLCSVVAAQRYAAVIAKAMAGQLADARRLLDDPDGRWGASDPLPRRFDEAGLVALLTEAGLAVGAIRGVRVLADVVARNVLDEPGDAAALAELELAAAAEPALRSIAAALHILARRP